MVATGGAEATYAEKRFWEDYGRTKLIIDFSATSLGMESVSVLGDHVPAAGGVDASGALHVGPAATTTTL